MNNSDPNDGPACALSLRASLPSRSDKSHSSCSNSRPEDIAGATIPSYSANTARRTHPSTIRVKKPVGAFNEFAIVTRAEIEVDVARERDAFVANRRRAFGKGNSCELSQRDLRAGRSGNQNLSQLIEIVPEIGSVADRDRIPLRPSTFSRFVGMSHSAAARTVKS
jgi:hypothetical protein